jgi:hypothetical protein
VVSAAGVDSFRGKSQEYIMPNLVAIADEAGLDDFFGCAGIGGAFQDDEFALAAKF